ncbi:hypothetical protein QFZ28_000718 [Neobacillus niacini]|uniref:hypothetical protein n=1 Tax=Neobacillus niacini TaxID=86668 RepID=UPI002786BAC2|nr:hypothetical protein [Neobacillus niacini]MDQ1000318.1 hypothetical protein [Neobacillus niacini]
MNVKAQCNSSKQADFSKLLKKAYEKGLNESELTLDKIIEDLKADLKNMMIN